MVSDLATIRCAPLMQCLVRASKLRIGSVMERYRRLARGSRHAIHVTFWREGTDYLDAKIDRHDLRTFVMIEKDIVSVGAQARVLTEEGPHFVECRLERQSDIPHRDAFAYCREYARRECFHSYLICHDNISC